MENLTVARQIIKEHRAEPLAGHTVVVLERVGEAGESVHSAIEPNGPPARGRGLRGLMGLGGTYTAYAVTRAPELRHQFTQHVRLDDHVHDLTVVIDLVYRVANPSIVVELRHQDPLRAVERNIAAVVAREVCGWPWPDIKARFRDVERQTLDASLPELREHAAAFGLDLRKLTLNAVLDEAGVAPDLARAKGERDSEIADVEKERKLRALDTDRVIRERELMNDLALQPLTEQLEAARGRTERLGAFNTAMTTAVKRVAEGIATPQEFYDAAQVVTQIFTRGQQEEGRPALGGVPVAGALPSAESGTDAFVRDCLTEIGQMSCSFTQKRQLRSAVLHLIAELLDEDSTDERCAPYVDKVRQLAASVQPPASAAQMKFFQVLCRVSELRSRLAL